METKVIHRKLSDWEFRAIETTVKVNGKLTNIVYGHSHTITSGTCTITKTLELYRGKNYIVGSTDHSWSRCYKIPLFEIPQKYSTIYNELIKTYNETTFD